MIDGNISMEEDTELRDLVVQTLESNGVLAKIRVRSLQEAMFHEQKKGYSTSLYRLGECFQAETNGRYVKINSAILLFSISLIRPLLWFAGGTQGERVSGTRRTEFCYGKCVETCVRLSVSIGDCWSADCELDIRIIQPIKTKRIKFIRLVEF